VAAAKDEGSCAVEGMGKCGNAIVGERRNHWKAR
jgi:hypothetical protein